ncbi:MAG: thermonuclease family protein [Desulfamplus sp.]
MKKILLAVCILFLAVTASAFQGKIVKVTDGDTVEVLSAGNQLTKVRLYGIDAPESKQDFGQKAKQFVLDIAANKTVEVEAIDTDRYGRTVGVVRIGGTILNAEIVKAGLAWYYGQYCKSTFCAAWQQLEQQARSNKIGLWSIANPQPPWEFRRGAKESRPVKDTIVNTAPDAAGSFHGNVSSKKFHRQGCKHYDCKSCTAIFGSREEAVNAGYEPCGLCKP